MSCLFKSCGEDSTQEDGDDALPPSITNFIIPYIRYDTFTLHTSLM